MSSFGPDGVDSSTLWHESYTALPDNCGKRRSQVGRELLPTVLDQIPPMFANLPQLGKRGRI